MGMFTSVAVDEVRSRGSIKDGDVQKLDAAFRESQSITQAEAEELIALDAACPVKDPTWAPFLVEAVTDYVVTQAQPVGTGAVTGDQLTDARDDRAPADALDGEHQQRNADQGDQDVQDGEPGMHQGQI